MVLFNNLSGWTFWLIVWLIYVICLSKFVFFANPYAKNFVICFINDYSLGSFFNPWWSFRCLLLGIVLWDKNIRADFEAFVLSLDFSFLWSIMSVIYWVWVANLWLHYCLNKKMFVLKLFLFNNLSENILIYCMVNLWGREDDLLRRWWKN